MVNEIWSSEKCKDWLALEVVSGKTSLKAFTNRLVDWHLKQYENNGNPPILDWADKCLETMHQAIRDMNLEEQKKSVFEKLRRS